MKRPDLVGWQHRSILTRDMSEQVAAVPSGASPDGGLGPAPAGRFRLTRLRLAAVGLAIVVGLVFSIGFAGFVGGLDVAEREPSGSADGIVALTGGAQRIEDAIDLLARGYGQRLLITGVNVRTDRDAIARLSPRKRALVDCCVDLDYRAQNTVGNALETRRWAHDNGFRSLIVVTSNYHMPRTMAELDHVLPEARKASHSVVTSAVDPRRWWKSPTAIRVLVSEYAKFLAVRVRTHLVPAPPEERGQRSAWR